MLKLGSFILACSILMACGGDSDPIPDAATIDASPPDAAEPDAGPVADAGPMADAGPTPDAAVVDDGIVIINEVLYDISSGDQFVELKNNDSVPIDIGAWRLCGASLQYYTLPADIVLQPGQMILVHWRGIGTNGMPAGHFYTGTGLSPLGDDTAGTDQSIALYWHTGGFVVSTSQRDFVQWNAANQARADVAQTAGLWTASQFVNPTGTDTSMCYNGGATDGPSGFTADSTPTPLANNGDCN